MKLPEPWRMPLLALGALFVVCAVAFAPVYRQMATIWWDNDTFAHGMVVIPIVLWLVYNLRAELLNSHPKTKPWALLVILGACVLWGLGELAQIASWRMFGAVIAPLGAVWLCLGTNVCSRMLFPLLFTLFAVPFGDFLIEPMMNTTADVVIAMLRFTGLPVFRYGRGFDIASGSWVVVEGCSGLRYLIASVMLGTLFAYLNYRSYRKRAIFIVVSILVPIVANWIRAYGIVMVAHLSGNRLAVGIDHIVSGWVFFGAVIFLLFMIGMRYADRETAASTDRAASPASIVLSTANESVRWGPVALAAVCVAAGVFGLAPWIQFSPPPKQALTLDAVVRAAHAFEASSESTWSPAYTDAHDKQAASFRARPAEDATPEIELWVARYRNQAKTGRMVTYGNRLQEFGDGSRARAIVRPQTVQLGERALVIEESDIETKAGRRLVWRAYRVGDTDTSSDSRAKLITLRNQLTLHGDASVVWILSTRIRSDGPESARAALARWLAQAGGALDETLRTANR